MNSTSPDADAAAFASSARDRVCTSCPIQILCTAGTFTDDEGICPRCYVVTAMGKRVHCNQGSAPECHQELDPVTGKVKMTSRVGGGFIGSQGAWQTAGIIGHQGAQSWPGGSQGTQGAVHAPFAACMYCCQPQDKIDHEGIVIVEMG